MSDEDQGGDNKGFLARWSQRKHEAKQPDRDAPPADTDVAAEPVAQGDAAPEFDLSSLPKLEDLTATTDITAFLRKGVPEHLRNAALRKSWALDPAIRNYVNPALDYAYDWNTPGGVPGSSEIGAGMDIARLVSQIMGGDKADERSAASADPATELASDPAQSPEPDPLPKPEPDLPAQAVRLSDEVTSLAQGRANAEGGAIEVGQEPEPKAAESVAPQQAVRRHGTAKPLD